MSIFNNNILAGAASQSSGTAVHTIDQSIRFNALDNPYMSKAFSSKGSPKKFTLSWWTKLGERTIDVTSESQMFFIAYHSSGYQTDFSIQSAARAGGVAHTFRTYSTTTGGSAVWNFTTTQVFRDPSAWYNFVVVSDTDNDASTERFKLYVNGQRVTDFSTATYPSSGAEPVWNNSTSVTHYIGSRGGNVNTRFDGYMAEMVHVDGQALTPSSFGETNSSGIWVPKDVSGLTFGTNGFHIDGRDSSDLGDDESGQGNDFSTSGLASDDQKTDSPTNNHAVWSSITGSAQVYSNGNLNAASSTSAWKGGLTTVQVPLNSGTWYYEVYVDSAGSSSGQFSVGWSESNRSISDDNSGGDTEGWITYAINGNYYARSGAGSYGASYTTGDVIGCKINTNTSTNNVEWYKNGASQGTRSEPLNLGGTGFISPYILLYATRNGTARFAQNEWTQTPSGITEDNAINTKNLGAE